MGLMDERSVSIADAIAPPIGMDTNNAGHVTTILIYILPQKVWSIG